MALGDYLNLVQHKYIRSRDLSAIVERPERLRAINVGLSAAIARLEELIPLQENPKSDTGSQDAEATREANDLVDVMNKLTIDPNLSSTQKSPVRIIHSQATSNILSDPAIKFIHGDIERDEYLENLSQWIKESQDKISNGGSEIPEGYAQGDLYLCPGSLNALQGAVGTVCEAVDDIMSSCRSNATHPPLHRAFVAIRPPGHHCGEDTPSGFCFLNNVAVGAAHAHLQHGVKRVVIFDIDLHHGNGTQSVVWQINEETYRQTLESEGGSPNEKTGPQVYYGSIHDILSYPCEDGKVPLVQAASVSLHKSHGQYIENIHLETYTSEEHFWDVLYKDKYSKLLSKARDFLDDTGGPGDDVLVFISCGMDACEHEYESMSRHNRKVPASFYHRFARDACAFSDRYAGGRLISVLEGGYSDRALISGAMAHLSGLVDTPDGIQVDEQWWSIPNLVKLEAATKKRRGGRPSLPAKGSVEPWIERTLSIFSSIDGSASTTSSRSTFIPPSSRTLRDRTKGREAMPKSPPASSASTKPVSSSKVKPGANIKSGDESFASTGSSPLTSPSPSSSEDEAPPIKRLPKVILKLGKAPESPSS
ncbi:Histone deacetylase HOS3 [Psilocybe cubensis]|uniref:Histone deacetylase HOS3 n=1 Tax=Psilocybe cubensis TaxID=181762 RepID=A0ACB8GZC7_PSICU|nr:Histone deacetylase HOS3 [Psilocybe cubensis]KAH9480787.1 Histone deacetylase HOS3 [Psilocybe cubensis]